MCRGGLHICRLKRTTVCFPILFSADLNFALYKYKYRILIPFCLLNHPSRRPVLTRGAASYPPGLAALCRVPASIRGLRLARSPLRYRLASPPLAPNPGYCRPARSAAPLSPPPPLSSSSSLPCAPLYPRRPPLSLLLLPDGVASSEPRSVRADVIPGSERARSAARVSSGHPLAHSAPALYPRAPLLPPPLSSPPQKKSSADPPGRTTL